MYRIDTSSAFQPLRVSESMEHKKVAQWATLLSIPKNPLMAPPIELNPLPFGVRALQSIMHASGEMEIKWKPFIKEDLDAGIKYFWADVTQFGEFNPETTTISDLVLSITQNRPLTLTELILVMKCEFLAKYRTNAIKNGFQPVTIVDFNLHMCDMYLSSCICTELNK
jgi:hypothetical protein